MTDDELRDRLEDLLVEALEANAMNSASWQAGTCAYKILPLVRAEIAAAEHRGAERAAQAVEEAGARHVLSWHDGDGGVVIPVEDAAGVARAAVPAPTGDNA